LNLESMVPVFIKNIYKRDSALLMKVRELYEKMNESQNKLYFSLQGSLEGREFFIFKSRQSWKL